MSRELQIIDALAELSADRKEVDLDAIQAVVERRERELLPDTWKQVARQTLRTLAGLGMVEIDSDDSSRLRYEKVRLTEEFMNNGAVRAVRVNEQKSGDRQDERRVNLEHDPQPPGNEADTTRGGGGRRGNGGNGSDEGDGGGEGFREVLAHPYLFSLSATDFDDILDQI